MGPKLKFLEQNQMGSCPVGSNVQLTHYISKWVEAKATTTNDLRTILISKVKHLQPFWGAQGDYQ